MRHLAIIADGNRRWAVQNGLPKGAGYSQGLITIENCCEWAIKNNVKYLTFYCFSTENWKRDKKEISELFNLAEQYMLDQKDWYINKGISVNFLGRKDRLSRDLVEAGEQLETLTKDGKNLSLFLCIDYGGRDEIVRAVQAGAHTEQEITDYLTTAAPEPDLILRTGGQKRLSNFLLWQSAYSELMFLDCFFPELDTLILEDVLNDFQKRSRNYGA